MARIFLSYSREDRETAQRIAALLEAAGFEVCLEVLIVVGLPWHEAREEALERADCVLVLWSRHSVESEWVREEAEEAKVRGKQLPVTIESVQPPLGFRSIQALDLAGWDGSFQAAEAQMLVDALRRRVRESSGEAPTAAPAPAAPSRSQAGGIGRTVAAGAAGLATAAGRAVRALGRRIATMGGGERPERPAPEPASPPPPARESGFPSASDEDLRTTMVLRRPRDSDEGRVAELSGEPDPQAVMLAVAAPRRAQPGSSFSARFAAYVEAARESAKRHLKELGERGDRVVLDLPPDRQPHWRVGAPVTVRLSGAHLVVSPAERSFEWNGRENILSFAVSVAPDAPAARVQLCFQVFLGPVEISVVNLGVDLGAGTGDAPLHGEVARMPSSAFASYASRDAAQVAQRLSTLAHWAPSLDIFQDCLDLTPNEDFKPQLAKQIAAREVFLLFWSRNAQASRWVRWELDTARAKPGLDAILPMPLEDPAIAPPPPGFEDRHLRDRYLIAGYGLGKIAETAAASPPA